MQINSPLHKPKSFTVIGQGIFPTVLEVKSFTVLLLDPDRDKAATEEALEEYNSQLC